MSAQDLADPPDWGTHSGSDCNGTSKKRRSEDLNHENLNEPYRDHPWFSVNDKEVENVVREMCDAIINALEKYAIGDEKIERLVLAAKKARHLPRLEEVNLAVLGEQGVGKSSLVNALLDRKLLDRSGGRKACTSFATVIEYLEGADDNTQESNVKIQFSDMKSMQDNIDEHIARWTDVYPDAQTSGIEDRDEHLDAESPEEEHPTQQDAKKVPRELKRGMDTAKDFFCVLFNIAQDKMAETWLGQVLYDTDIREGDFRTRCYRQAEDRIDQIRNKLRMCEGTSTYANTKVHDKHLPAIINIAKNVWPFVKLFTISTGHMLLRYGVRFFDVPGYGDSSNLRRATVNEFRWKADVEMIVTRSSRLQTSEIQQEYIDLAMRLKKKNKPILVMNMIDELINENDYSDAIKQIPEAPFMSFSQRLEEIEQLAEEGTGDKDELFDEVERITKKAIEAFIAREIRLAVEEMQYRGIDIFATSASQWMGHLQQQKGMCRSAPILSPELTGIQQLRRYLITLTADTNLEIYRNHVFKTLGGLRQSADRVLNVYPEDKSYAAMRQSLREKIPALENILNTLATGKPDFFVKELWHVSQKYNIIAVIANLINTTWIHSRIAYSSFAKMVRENGIPVSGKFHGSNLNREILPELQKFIDAWRDSMIPRVEQLSILLTSPVNSLLRDIQTGIDGSTAVPDLKASASQALRDTIESTEYISYELVNGLRNSLVETHLRFTTEIDIHCPVATAMKPVYESASVISGKGAYEKKRRIICETIANPPRSLRPLLDNLSSELMSRQKEAWVRICTTFVEDAISQLHQFSNVCEDLLSNAAYATEQHKKARDDLDDVLIEFDFKWANLKSHFPIEKEQPRKRVKHTAGDDTTTIDPNSAMVIRN